MMTSLSQPFSPHPGAMQQHPGMAPGHQMVHNPGQPGPGMPQQLHMGVSGPGPQIVQGGAMMAGMPPGAGGPSAHALSHLNPNQQQQQMMMNQQQAAMFASNPQLQQMHQQQQIQMQQQRQQQAARQAMLAQQYSGMPVGMPNGINQMTPAQFQAMRGAGPMARPVNLPQHLQQQQQQAEQSALQHQAQAHAQQQHQQMMMAQQLAMQQAQQPGSNPQVQANQISAQQPQNMQQAQTAMMQQQAHQQQQANAHAAAAAQQTQNQSQSQTQSQPQQAQSNTQSQPQQPQTPQQQPGISQQTQAAAAIIQQQQQRQGDKLKGQCLMKLMQFGDHLSNFVSSTRPLQWYLANTAQGLDARGQKQKDDLFYWFSFVERFFSPKGHLRHSVWLVDENSNKQFEITYPALPRYFHTHFESGVKNMQMIVEGGTEKELPNNNHYIESHKSSFIYWFDNGSQLIATGTLKAHFDADQKIELLEFITSSHEEYLPRTRILEAARPLHEWQKEWQKVNSPADGKPSPEMNKKGKQKPMKSPAQPPPEIDIPASKVKPSMGLTPSVFRFLEFAEVMVQMNPLFNYSHQNASLAPYNALEQYVATVTTNGANSQNPGGPRTPGMNNFPVGASPAQAHLNLPGGSPLIGGSPAQAPGMQLQQSQHGTSSSGPSANTSPNVNNKRRRPSTVKAEEENQVNGTQSKTSVKPSPRIGGKRQKGNPA